MEISGSLAEIKEADILIPLAPGLSCPVSSKPPLSRLSSQRLCRRNVVYASSGSRGGSYTGVKVVKFKTSRGRLTNGDGVGRQCDNGRLP